MPTHQFIGQAQQRRRQFTPDPAASIAARSSAGLRSNNQTSSRARQDGASGLQVFTPRCQRVLEIFAKRAPPTVVASTELTPLQRYYAEWR